MYNDCWETHLPPLTNTITNEEQTVIKIKLQQNKSLTRWDSGNPSFIFKLPAWMLCLKHMLCVWFLVQKWHLIQSGLMTKIKPNHDLQHGSAVQHWSLNSLLKSFRGPLRHKSPDMFIFSKSFKNGFFSFLFFSFLFFIAANLQFSLHLLQCSIAALNPSALICIGGCRCWARHCLCSSLSLIQQGLRV